MCTEGRPCSYCREVLEEGSENGGVAGLFDDDPANIALIPTEVTADDESRDDGVSSGKRA
jgi:hypothetical protein